MNIDKINWQHVALALLVLVTVATVVYALVVTGPGAPSILEILK